VFNVIKASVVSCALFAFSIVTHAETYTYRLTEIGKDGRAVALNKSGHVTGSSKVIPCCRFQAFLWTGTQPATQIPASQFPEFAVRSTGVDINNQGLVVVFVDNDDVDDNRSYIWDGTTKPLVLLPGEANAINESGQVTGGIEGRAYVWKQGSMRDLGPGTGADINGSGHVTGVSGSHAALWRGDTFTDLGTLGGATSSGSAINGKNQITGVAQTVGNAAQHAFLWENGLMIDLGSLPGSAASLGNAINNFRQVVGTAHDGQLRALRPFLWENGTMRDLNDLIDPGEPLTATLFEATDINGAGQITARGFNADNNHRTYLLSPRYKLTNILRPTASSVARGSTVRIAVGVLDAENARIPDARAAILASSPCRVQVRATGAQTLAKACMAYDPDANQFVYNWGLGLAGTGAATIEVRVNYGAPGPLKTIRTKAITITN
jgi:probable HAF family extracellular repeat protein